ncbi:phage GP46 family protein [Pseudomonas juntendi]|uniref:Phage GP46 family protein n=1 Tax=Pseudomonas juntendi TaxID=2666183 RepID=A0A7W2LZ99_9PSED|nr:phage GP46 family protein [Pseudomonas juntendi]MBA6130779.1 phage GP46 family protein [Pseudomonas juntendi]MBA6149807.1 phage GP46 family protein [Pseudomonas juntendi]
MDASINPTTGDLTGQRITTLANAVYLRLMTPLGSYWADPALGSRLHELQREKDRPRVGTLAIQYAQQALNGLVEDGRATSVEVTAEQQHDGRLRLLVEVYAPAGRQTFEHLVRVI